MKRNSPTTPDSYDRFTAKNCGTIYGSSYFTPDYISNFYFSEKIQNGNGIMVFDKNSNSYNIFVYSNLFP